MYSEFITRITYNFSLEMFMVVGMVGRKDRCSVENTASPNQAFRHNRQAFYELDSPMHAAAKQ